MCGFDPVTAAIGLATGAMSFFKKQPEPPKAAPAKTDADIAQEAEEERRRMGLSSVGFGTNFSSKIGSAGSYTPAPLKSLTLG